MLFVILLFLKILLFMNITNVQYNKFWVFGISALFILFIYSIIYFGKWKKKDRKGLIVYFILSSILLIDVVHFGYFNTLPSVKMLSQVGQVAAVKDSVKFLLTFENLLMLIDLPILIGHFVWKKRKGDLDSDPIYNVDTRKTRKLYFLVPLSLALVIGLSLGYLFKADKYMSVANQELFLFHARDIKQAFSGDMIEATDIDSMKTVIEDAQERARLKEGKHTGLAKGKNLIVLQVEALQEFAVGLDYDGQEITPNLNKLVADKGTIYFDNYYQLTGRGNTSDAEFISNNSLHPSMNEPSYTEYENNSFYGLPWLLRDNGYRAWAFHGFERDFWNRDRAYKNQGFERFVAQDDFDLNEIIGFGITDREFYKQSMDYLKELDQLDDNPFYAFMVSLTSHNPFKMPKAYHHIELRPEHKDTILGDYLQSIHYADRTIGEFLDMLKEDGLYEDTAIAIYGDHFAINSMDDDTKELMTDFLGYPYEVDEMMRIPLIIHVPGEEIKETVTRVGSQLDFYPTIANIMGYDNEKGLVFGRDLLNYEGENIVSPQTLMLKGSFIKDEEVFVMSRDGLFENSRAYELRSKKDIEDLSQYRTEYDEVIREINACDYFLKFDMFKPLLEGKDLASILSSVGDAERRSNIGEEIVSVEPSFEALDEKVAEGKKYLRTNLHLDTSGKEEEWARFGDSSFLELADWLRDNPDVHLMLYAEKPEQVGRVFDNVTKFSEDVIDQLTVEIYDIAHYVGVSKKGIEVFLDIRGKDSLSDDDLEDIIQRFDLDYVGMDEERAKSGSPEFLNDLGVFSYVYDLDGEIPKKYLKKKGVEGFVN